MGDRVPCYGMLRMFAAAAGLASGLALAQAAPFMIVGNDEKRLWDDRFNPLLSPPGRDSVLIVDLADPMNPKIVANLPLKNSVIGPPVNLAIDPSGSIALVADSIDVIKDGESLQQVPDDKVHVIDLKADPPKAIGTVTVGKQPSGLSINPAGTLALVANREDKSISVLSIKGTEVKLIDTIAMGDSVAHATFTPDGKPWRSNFLRTRCHCSRSPATRSPTGSWTCRPGCGRSMWRWPPAARSP